MPEKQKRATRNRVTLHAHAAVKAASDQFRQHASRSRQQARSAQQDSEAQTAALRPIRPNAANSFVNFLLMLATPKWMEKAVLGAATSPWGLPDGFHGCGQTHGAAGRRARIGNRRQGSERRRHSQRPVSTLQATSHCARHDLVTQGLATGVAQGCRCPRRCNDLPGSQEQGHQEQPATCGKRHRHVESSTTTDPVSLNAKRNQSDQTNLYRSGRKLSSSARTDSIRPHSRILRPWLHGSRPAVLMRAPRLQQG